MVIPPVGVRESDNELAVMPLARGVLDENVVTLGVAPRTSETRTTAPLTSTARSQVLAVQVRAGAPVAVLTARVTTVGDAVEATTTFPPLVTPASTVSLPSLAARRVPERAPNELTVVARDVAVTLVVTATDVVSSATPPLDRVSWTRPGVLLVTL